ncbi:MAG: hybrid sensor histidine kinase/response regulator, partial [Planctomycetes bacterium]|nr:hybrid sensor histidine kinase/response regulator [Planctomycetota bacterium]
KLKVLVVDDEPGMRHGATRALEKYSFHDERCAEDISFEIDQAADGKSALAKVAEYPRDIVLLDYKLPDMTGLELLEHFHKEGHDFLTIMITAYSSIDVAISATRNGAYAFLPKPFSPSELKTSVTRAARSLILYRKARKLEIEKHRIRFQFISVLAHELKAPLNAVESRLRLMDSKVLGDCIDEYQDGVRSCIHRIDGMRKLILDLLDLTRIESGQKKRNLQMHDMVGLVHHMLESVETEAHARNISFTVEGPDKLVVECDSGEMEIILNNLLTNAVKYNRDGGSVRICLGTAEGGFILSVSDTGIGMSPEEKEKLFGEFVRIKNSDTCDIPGSGLGLSILKKLVALYHGSIKVESVKGEGTTFTLIFKSFPGQKSPGLSP